MSNEKGIKSSLIFQDYIVDYVEFKTNDQFIEQSIDVDFKVDRTIEYDSKDDGIVYVSLHIKVFDNPVENNYPFSLKLILTGTFEIQEDDEEKREYFAKYNAVAILFPYARSLITNYTANANLPPLILPPINVLKLIE